jgi:hypothetical protein
VRVTIHPESIGWLQGAGQDYNGATRMIFTSGTKLGAYEIQSALGAGGAGNVCRALDTKLRRDVALNILPGTLAGDFIDSCASSVKLGCAPRIQWRRGASACYPRQARKHAVSGRMLGCYAPYVSNATLGLEAASRSRANRA